MIPIIRSCLLLMALAAANPERVTVWTEDFGQGRLDPDRWQLATEGDFRERNVDVAGGPAGAREYRLRLSADTRETRDDTVKFLGVRSIPAIQLHGDVRVSVDVDWNQQGNGSYLSAGVVLSPTATSSNPLRLPDWVKVEYMGVPPGQNARMVIALKSAGQERTLYNEGWPDTNRVGRTIGRQRVIIRFQDQTLQVWENDALVYDSKEKVVSFDGAFLYLQMASHSNYPQRTIYFGNIRVEEDR